MDKINIRIKSKSVRQRRPHTTQHSSHQYLTNTYKYLTLNANQHRNLAPYLSGVTRILNKIGTQKKPSMYQPLKEQQKQYRQKRYGELKQQLIKKRGRTKFQFEMDELVLDCYDHTIEQGRRSIWKKYRSNVDDLNFKVMRMKLTKQKSAFS